MRHGSLAEVFVTFLRLGCVCFGGPTAHIGVFRRHFVDQLAWLPASDFDHDLTMCQLVPGPASSQLGMLIGARRAGIAGSLAAWAGFTLPSALLLTAAALGSTWVLGVPGLTAGLLLGAAVTVGWAVLQMLAPLRTNPAALVIAALSTVVMLVLPAAQTQIVILLTSALAALVLPGFPAALPARPALALCRRWGGVLLGIGAVLLMLSWRFPSVDGVLYQTGALVFGGGHVVLPILLERIPAVAPAAGATVAQGYALAQLVPGPLFTLATYIGAVVSPQPVLGALTATVAVFLPGWLLILGVQPWWHYLAGHPAVGRALRGTHAAVVGLLAASGVTLLQTHVVGDVRTLLAAVVVWLLLLRSTMPPWTVALVCGLYGVLVLR
jgi:chromate transporter